MLLVLIPHAVIVDERVETPVSSRFVGADVRADLRVVLQCGLTIAEHTQRLARVPTMKVRDDGWGCVGQK